MNVCALASSQECAHKCECKALTEAWLAANEQLVAAWPPDPAASADRAEPA